LAASSGCAGVRFRFRAASGATRPLPSGAEIKQEEKVKNATAGAWNFQPLLWRQVFAPTAAQIYLTL